MLLRGSSALEALSLCPKLTPHLWSSKVWEGVPLSQHREHQANWPLLSSLSSEIILTTVRRQAWRSLFAGEETEA